MADKSSKDVGGGTGTNVGGQVKKTISPVFGQRSAKRGTKRAGSRSSSKR